jgi:membrane-associated protease RseP (regulator of RpoE activity)
MRPILPLLLAAAALAGEAAPPAQPPVVAGTPPTVQPAPRPYLGVSIDPAGTIMDKQGLAVLRVEAGSPAAVMGIQAGDRLIALDDQPLKTQDDLMKALSGRKPGDQVKLDVVRAQGKDNLPQRLTVAGALQEQPRGRTTSLTNQLSDLQARVSELNKKAKEPTLAELLQQLKEIEANVPKAAAEFKRIYPDGEFRIAISVEITSDKRAKDPLTIDVGGKKPEAQPEAAKPEAPKAPEMPKAPEAPKQP